jgi:hypothetical protein
MFCVFILHRILLSEFDTSLRKETFKSDTFHSEKYCLIIHVTFILSVKNENNFTYAFNLAIIENVAAASNDREFKARIS